LRQLKPGGRLVGVLGGGPLGKAMLYRATGGECAGRPIFDAAAPLLPGFTAPAAFVF
jgi:protein-L-isoaspartate(D-aspartate) O-methyltransferase